MTDEPEITPDPTAPAAPSAPATPTGDPELDALAALVRRDEPDAAGDEAPAPMENGVDAVPVEPVAAAVTAAEPLSDTLPVARPRRRRRSLVLGFGVAFALGLALAVGIGAAGLYAWGQQYEGRILPGVRIGTTDLGGMTREQAEAAITGAYASLGSGQIALVGPDGASTLAFSDVSRGPDTAALLDAAFATGRDGDPLARLLGPVEAALHGVTLQPAVTYDRARLAAAVEALAQTIDQAPTDASVSGAPAGAFVVTPATEGRQLDTEALLAALDAPLASLDAPSSITLDVPVVALAPAVATDTAEAARAAAQRMVADVVVARGEDTWTIPGTSLTPLVSFATGADGSIAPVLDETGLDPLVAALAKDVKQTVRDAGLKLVGGRVVATGKSHEGRTLKADGMKAAIVAELGARQAGATATPVEAVIKAVEPKLTLADAEKYAPKMKVIGDFSVYYWVIINNHWGGNIEGPATVINGTVVPAGAKFDFWKVVGDLRDAPGVGPGNAIENGKITVTGAFGGGICTTSTTLFNAALEAGMVPLQRQNHTEFIDRYPPGLDATVWIVGRAKQTMSFRNDTEYPILITRNVTGNSSKRWLTFKIWSVPNGRKMKLSNLVIQPGEKAIDTVVKDPTKPVGYTYRNNTPVDGAKVWVTVSIYEHGKLHFRKRYFSNYPAMDGVLIVGTKGS